MDDENGELVECPACKSTDIEELSESLNYGVGLYMIYDVPQFLGEAVSKYRCKQCYFTF